MCGIVGFFDKTQDNRHRNVGGILIPMLKGVGCRGPDSAGVAIFTGHKSQIVPSASAVDPVPIGGAMIGEPVAADYQAVFRIKLSDNGDFATNQQKLTNLLDDDMAGNYHLSARGHSARLTVDQVVDLPALAGRIEALGKDVEVVSMGQSLEIVKQVGSPDQLEATYGVSQLMGTHGVGHTRLSTESKVDLSHSQPFGSHQRPDLAIVHNGHITNYHQLRRVYEQRHIRFYTENDSEVVAIYIAGQLNKGRTLKEALHQMLSDLDGSFSCLVATPNQFGFVKDPFALKPLLWAETEDFVALANEEIAIRAALPGNYEAREAQAKEVRVWER